MIYLQIYDIPRLAAEGGGNLAEILGIVAVAVVGALVFWIIKLDKQKNEIIDFFLILNQSYILISIAAAS